MISFVVPMTSNVSIAVVVSLGIREGQSKVSRNHSQISHLNVDSEEQRS